MAPGNESRMPLIHSAEELLLEAKLISHILCLHISHFALERERKVVSGRQNETGKLAGYLRVMLKLLFSTRAHEHLGCSRGRISLVLKHYGAPRSMFDTQEWKWKAMNLVEVQFVIFAV